MTTNSVARKAQTILTPQKGGFLQTGPHPFTHTLTPYVGCSFGGGACGKYCYAQYLPSFVYDGDLRGTRWGDKVVAKVNAGELLREALRKMSPTQRQQTRIFCASATDPYQAAETEYSLMPAILEALTQHPVGLVVIQTRAPLAQRDMALMKNVPNLWLSVSIETDSDDQIARLGFAPPLSARWRMVERMSGAGVPVQVAVSPCLPYSPDFAQRIADSAARRVVVDNFVEGDGTRGARTASSPIAKLLPSWSEVRPSLLLYQTLIQMGYSVIYSDARSVGYSAAGFCGIPSGVVPRPAVQHLLF